MKISEIIHRQKILPVQSRKISQQKTFGVSSDIIEFSSTTRIRDMKKDVDGAFKVKFDKLLGALNQYQVYELSTGDYSGQLETILKKAKHINEVLAVLKKYAFFPNEKMRDIADEFVEDIDKFNAFHKMRIKRDFTKQVYQEMNENPPVNDEPLQSYVCRKINTVEHENAKKLYEHLEQVKSKIRYSTDTGGLESIQLTPEERLALAHDLELDGKISDYELYEQFINKYVEGKLRPSKYSARVTNAVLQTQPRYYYKTKKTIDNEYPHEPLYRWLSILDKPDEFVDKMFKIGQIYKYPYMQSCSKDRFYAENQYRYDLKELNVQFIIHPHSAVSKAYDIGHRSYGANEAIYPAETKFNVLDKRLEECNSEFGETFYRWIIEMQEV